MLETQRQGNTIKEASKKEESCGLTRVDSFLAAIAFECSIESFPEVFIECSIEERIDSTVAVCQIGESILQAP